MKKELKRQHCSPKDITLQTMVSSLTAMTGLHQHNNQSKLIHDPGMQHSADLVGEERRLLLSEIISSADPFNMSREPVQVNQLLCILFNFTVSYSEVVEPHLMKDFHVKSSGSPFGSYTLSDATKFVARAKKSFSVDYARSDS